MTSPHKHTPLWLSPGDIRVVSSHAFALRVAAAVPAAREGGMCLLEKPVHDKFMTANRCNLPEFVVKKQQEA